MKKLPIPLNDRVLLELVMETETAGGIKLPEREVKYAYVRAIGANVKEVSTGDKVYLPKGDKIGDRIEVDGTKYLLLPVAYIAAIIP